MNEYKNISGIKFDNSSPMDPAFDNIQSLSSHEIKHAPSLIQLSDTADIKKYSEDFLLKARKPAIKKTPDLLIRNNPEKKVSVIYPQIPSSLFRLFVKNGEYVYARANDIIMMESCDHLVKVYLAFNDKIKKTVRHNTLKDFLLQLPQEQFMRIGRFCAVNMQRLSGGNCNEQTFEFDFRVSVKLKHAISHSAFYSIGK